MRRTSVDRLLDLGLPTRPGAKPSWDLRDVAAWMLARERSKASRPRGESDERLRRAKAQMAELRYREARGALVSRERVVNDTRELLVGLRTRLMRTPMDSCPECREKVEREVRAGMT